MEYDFFYFEQNPRIFSIIISIFLILGTIQIGRYLSNTQIFNFYKKYNDITFQFIIGNVIVLTIIYPIFLFFKVPIILIKIFSFFLIVFGIMYLYSKKNFFL